MIVFTRVQFKNFLGAGNAPIEVALNRHASTLVIGINGAGKSTFSEAICFALFGRPIRNVNKPRVVNVTNQRDCLVELDFMQGEHTYRIRRGLKPNVFEIYHDDQLIEPPSSAADYQTMLETNILHFNHKAFSQVVVLVNSMYVPFMRLPAATRRELVEDLLDIKVFSQMQDLAKDDSNNLRAKLDECALLKKVAAEQLKMAERLTSQLTEQRQQTLEHLRGLLFDELGHETQLAAAKQEIETRMTEYATVRADLRTIQQSIQDYRHKQAEVVSALKALQKERAFYDDHDSCPTCEQAITEDFKQQKYVRFDKKEAHAAKATAFCEHILKAQESEHAEIAGELRELEALEKALAADDAQLSLVKSRIAELERSIAKEQETHEEKPTVNIQDLHERLNKLDDAHATLSRKRVIVDAALMLLKDSGIKTRVVKHYLPIINKTLNHYLNAMEFPIGMGFDEEFSEHFTNRRQQDFVYDLFSDGQKKRIDLSLLLTWRYVAKLKNSVATNLLILDEVTDSSLDANGVEEFLKIVFAMETEISNVFIISHKDLLMDKFTNVLHFEQVRGFTQLKA